MDPDRPTHDDAQDTKLAVLQAQIDALKPPPPQTRPHMNTDDDDNEAWHLDRRVPITLIITLLLQAGAGLWFAAKMDSRLVALEEARLEQRGRDDRQDRAVSETATLIRGDLSYIRQQLDQLIRDGVGVARAKP